MSEPFGRQPKPVRITITGEREDVDYWMREFMRRAAFKDDLVRKLDNGAFDIFPRAVND